MGVTDDVLEPKNKKPRVNGIRPQEFERLRSIAHGAQTVTDVIEIVDVPSHDPWAVANPQNEVQESKFPYLDRPKPIRTPNTLHTAFVSLAAGSGEIPAVPTPKPYTSYNPAFDDWDTFFTAEGQKEVEAEKRRLREAEHEQARLHRILEAQNEHEYVDIQTDDESAWEGFESDRSGIGHLEKKRPERKTPAERNKIKRRKEMERKERHESRMKQKEKQQNRIGEIIKLAKYEAKASAQGLESAKGQKDDEQLAPDERRLRRKKSGKDAYGSSASLSATTANIQSSLWEPPLDLVLPEELRDSLRLLKPEGNLLNDRFRSILIRGKLETRKPIQQPKKKRMKVTEKWSYKDFAIPT